MKISIITPSFNQGKFISRCLASVKSQHGNFDVEHIILDNCSTDNTIKLLKEYQSNPGHVDVRIIIEKDSGQTSAINKGFGLATGDIVCWLNTDEWYSDDALLSISQFFSTNSEVDLVFGDCDFVNETGTLIRQKRERFFSKSMLLYYGCFIPSCATFIRRTIIDNGLLLRPKFKVTMDFDWYVRIAEAGYNFAHLPATIASFTWHTSNISSTLVQRRLQERRIVQDEFSQICGPDFIKTIIFKLMYYFWIAVRIIKRRTSK